MEVAVKSELVLFKPIEIKILVQSEEELCDLWLRMNLSRLMIDTHYDDKEMPLKFRASNNSQLWKALNGLVMDRGLDVR